MRKSILVNAGVLVALVALTSWSWAGDYHYGVDLVCQDCHVMHYSQSHGYNPDGGGFFAQPGVGGPFEFLLRNDINDLCLTCHDGSPFAPDVFEAHSNGYVRQAGALNELGGNGLYPEFTGHTLNSTATAPGSDPAWSNPDGLNCANCHGVHGRTRVIDAVVWPQGGYRNLFTEDGPSASITYTRGDVEGVNPTTAWIHEDASGGTNAQHYGIGGITFNEPEETKSGYADFCKDCHTNFHGDVGGAEIGGVGSPAVDFVRHPTNGVNIGQAGGGHSSMSQFAGEGASQVQVMSPAGKKAGTYLATDVNLTPSCMSCHKGHGNQNAFGLIYVVGVNAGGGAMTEQGDGGTDARSTCRACHRQGGAATSPW